MNKANDLAALRMRFDGGRGERPGGNPVLELCDEVERLRAEKVQLVTATSAALQWSGGQGPFAQGRDTICNLAEVIAPALEAALAGTLDLAAFLAELKAVEEEAVEEEAAPEGGA